MKMPSSVASWTTKLMSLVPGPRRLTPCRASPSCGAGCATSKPQNQAFAPVTKRVFVTVACSPGYWRTTMGASAVPIKVLAKPLGSAAFVYVPPRSQIVLPGVTAAGPLRAVARSHGFAQDPLPDGDPLGDTKKSAAVGSVSAVGGGVPMSSCTQSTNSSEHPSANDTQSDSARSSIGISRGMGE